MFLGDTLLVPFHLYVVISVSYLVLTIYSVQVNPRNYKLEIIAYRLDECNTSFFVLFIPSTQLHRITIVS